MIKTFAGATTAKVWARQRTKAISLDLQRAAYRKLLMIDAAESIEDLRVPPGNRLEKLSGTRDGFYSIRVNDQWRICFDWADGAYEVELVDYH
jgi:proteic killer suppression protein